MKQDFTCGFIGLGLIGGSIARAIRQNHPCSRLLAYDINQTALDAAYKDGVIDMPLHAIGEEISCCDYLFLCAPVSENDHNLSRIKKYLSPACLLTDVGSVKTDIHRHIERAHLSRQFIGDSLQRSMRRTGAEFPGADPLPGRHSSYSSL